MSKTFQSLRHRNFRLFFIGQSISNSGNWLTSIALTLLVLRLTGSGVAVGWLAACQYGPILLLSPWGGALADRSDKRKLLFVTQGLEMAQSIGLAVLAFQPHPSYVALYALAIAGGVVLSLDNPLRRSFVTEMAAWAGAATTSATSVATINRLIRSSLHRAGRSAPRGRAPRP